MPFSTSPQCDLFRPVGTHDQDAAARQVPAQVEEQVDGTGICPLQVVHHQYQWRLTRQGLQHPRVLLEKIALLWARAAGDGRLAFHKFIQAG